MPLSNDQRSRLERRLLEERERTAATLGRLSQRFAETEQDDDGDLSKVPFHPADKGTDAFDREFDAVQETRLSHELAEIDAALDRLYREPDKFGQDERTGEDIPFERLELIPWARHGIE